MKIGLAFLAPAFVLLAGCAAQPKWVAAKPTVMCFSRTDKTCLGDLIAKYVVEAPVGTSRDRELAMATAVMAGAGIPEPQALTDLRAEMEASMCLKPDEAFLSAGKAVENARDHQFSEAINKAAQISEPDAKLFALQNIAVLAARANDELSTGKVLNLLNDTDKAAYMDGLQARLVSLLMVGDLERARSLQDALLSYYTATPGNTMSIAQVAITYATTGHVADANDFLDRASTHVAGLRTDDVVRLLNIMIKASNGDYPPPQDFYDFSSDSMRLQAYIQLSVFYGRAGQNGNSVRAAGDMVRFVQKSSFNVGRSETAVAMSKVLVEGM